MNGVIAWISPNHNYNDGDCHILNFTWGVDVTDAPPNQFAQFYFQVTADQGMPTFAEDRWDNFLWQDTILLFEHYNNDRSPETWSATISPSGVAKLYDSNGDLWNEQFLDTGEPWYFRFVVREATSAGFGASDARFNLYSFSSQSDTTPPEIKCFVDPAILRPSNHKMVDVTVDIEAIDDLLGTATLVGVFASSNEPDNGVADGNTFGDVDGEDGFVVDVEVTEVFAFVPEDGVYRGVISLRAERAGDGDGRVYTIEAFVSDEAGNIGNATCEIVVPHDKGKAKK